MVLLWLGFSLLASVSKHNALTYWYYGWVCLRRHLSVKTMCGRIMVEVVFIVIHQYTQYMDVLWLDLSLLLSVSKHNMWTYYSWVCHCCRPFVNKTCGRIMDGFVVVVVRQ